MNTAAKRRYFCPRTAPKFGLAREPEGLNASRSSLTQALSSKFTARGLYSKAISQDSALSVYQ